MPPAGVLEANASVMIKSNLHVGHSIKIYCEELENEIMLSII